MNAPRPTTLTGGLLAALDDVRQRGYATEIEELAFGQARVTAPIPDRT